ncbi:MAG: hypothetical protein RMJ53_08385 [Chitinophagales bacterium]|nr:hypothetical protein [Chitinophagales bacterium]MDW8274227.1 hypothetical protein [Chitinophagales bacterium]
MKKFIISFAAALPFCVAAQNSLNAKKVTIYKNGTALVVNEGTVKTKDGKAIIPLPDKALYGAYWVGAPKDNPIRSITFRNDTLKKSKRCESVAEYLAGNIGKQATVYLNLGTQADKSISGQIADFYQPTGMLKIKTDKGTSWLNVRNIYQVEFRDNENHYFLADSIQKMIIIQPEKNAPTIALQEFYLQSSMNWIPSYFIKLKDDKVARLEMKALIENGGEDIENAETELVVGAPQLAYGLKPDPMTYDYLTIEANDQSTAFANKRYEYKNLRVANAEMAMAVPDEGFFNQQFETEGEKYEDYYFYKLGKISLPKNAKGTFPIFAKEVEYKHKYECNIPDQVNFFYTRYAGNEENKYDVFHSLEFKNTTGMPLTGAPIMALNEKDLFLAQDKLSYVPANANASVKISKAVDVVLKNQEEEISRNDSYKKIGRSNYGKVVLKGNIQIENYQEKAIVLNVVKNLTGEITKFSDNAVVVKRKNYATGLNPVSEAKWEINLKPNEKKTITYEYEVIYQL